MTKHVSGRTAAVLAFGIALVAPAVAGADETIVAQFQDRYAQPSWEIDQGEKVFFRNDDTKNHNVESRMAGTDGKPLFISDIVGRGVTTPVKGTEYLTTGTYDFFCTIHTFMAASLTVNANGAPLPRPGGGGSGPTLSVALAKADLDDVARTGRLKVRTKVGGAASVKLTAKFGSKRLGTGKATFGDAGKKTVTVKLTSAGKRALRGRSKAKITVTGVATSDAGKSTKKSTRTFKG